VTANARKRGVARGLVDALVVFAEQHGYMDITARVAADLAANAVWEKMGFATVRTQPGGSVRNRTINVRMKQLNTPTLFGYPEGRPVSGLPMLARQTSGYTPVYAIDLNVFFDVVRRRPRAEYAAQVISAALDNVIRIVVAEEFALELKRSFKPDTPDPILEFALQLPTIPAPEHSQLGALVSELGGLIFPQRAKDGTCSVQDNSDLIHLATAIHHSAMGFVTAENALVTAANVIESHYGVKIVHVEHFAHLLQGTKRRIAAIDSRFAGKDLRISELTNALRADLSSIVDKIRVSDDFRQHVLAHGVHSSHLRSLALSFNGSLLCTALWSCTATLQQRFSATIVADEDQPAIESALDALFLAISAEAVANGPALIDLTIPNAHTVTREMALALGFVQKDSDTLGSGCYQRLAIGAPVSEQTWHSIRQLIATKTGNTFPSSLPAFSSSAATINFTRSDGTAHQISLDDLETALHPTVLCTKTRPCILVPIRRTFADHLLNTSPQSSLLPTNAAALFHERVYYSTSRNSKLFASGTILVFYESGRDHGRSAAVALARVRETASVSKQEVASALLRHGVLSVEEIEALSTRAVVAATIFDSVICFRNPISLSCLRELCCVDGANLVSARRLTTEQLNAIIRKGGQIGF
jgi:predicted GNAT superfamily acetyltransferase